MSAGSRQDALAIAQNGGQEIDDGEMDGENEIDMDDDMMDKISSSPSIEDGGSTYTLPCFPSNRVDDFSRRTALPTFSDARSSSPYLDCPDYVPVSRNREKVSFVFDRHHHQNGEFELHGTSEGLPDPTELYDNDPADAHNIGSRHYLPAQDEDTPGLVCTPKAMDSRTSTADRSSRGPSFVPASSYWTDVRDARPEKRLAHRPQDGAPPNVQQEYDDYDEETMTVPYEPDQDVDYSSDDDGDSSDDIDPRFVDSGWGGESLQDPEDIDFEFVYALHTFVATVEGQANATKGDTMVLLDDSNSYWWLVRVVKDSSIGYLPAEHIETPTERLARLNKHRNIDLSATMLGDQADKPKPTIIGAMKRRKAKTVQFAAPQYFEHSEVDYSSEEEDAQAPYQQQQQQQQQAQQQQQQQVKQAQQEDIDSEAEDESAKVEPLKPRSVQSGKGDTKKQEEVERSRTSEELLEPRVSGDGPKKTSDGTVRDSFFKDDTVETKKITLTPNLLRDDDAPRTSSDSKELKQRISFDKLDKENNLGKGDKRKGDKKEKDKKPSAIRSFFSRKDKKARGDEDDDSLGRRDSNDRDVPEEEEQQQTTPERAPAPQRQPSKLQKQMPRTEPSPTRKPNAPREGNGMDIKSFLSETKVNNVANVPPASMRLVEASPKASPDSSPRDYSRTRVVQNGNMRPQKAKQVTSRMELDDFDTTDEEEEMMSPEPELVQNMTPPVVQQVRQQQPQQQRPYTTTSNIYNHQPQRQQQPQQQQPQQQPRAAPPYQLQPPQTRSRVPEEVSPINGNNPPGLIVDTSSQEEENPQSPSPRSTPSPTELLNQHDEDEEDADTSGIKDSVATTVSSPRTSWNDQNLRAFFDSGSDIRDLLVVVYDKSNVDSVDASSHPVAGSLFREQNAKLAEITTQLDNMLGDWLARKQRLRGAV
ncbi:hypothetical protein QBC38DRAFT_468262 [Podospora fimiseda]|uniref:SH3 domain-containing protein n=1 Tax=Podospora fimiseda TaxID=252190 RepID=A0AAN7BWD5_9PEZI|nr:hypothetical protein QBC38DRAFT_468262 [Podospora fimiseda]